MLKRTKVGRELHILYMHLLIGDNNYYKPSGVLPTSSHSSYPYGNPYTLSLLPLRPSARSSKKGLKGNPHTRHLHTWTDLALEELLPWEGEEPDLNYFAGLEAEGGSFLFYALLMYSP